MRRLLFALCSALAAFASIGAAPPPSFLPVPTVIVYPLTVNGSDVDKESGSRLGVIIAQAIATAGGVTVKPPPPGTERKNFLDVARAQGADYYIAGYVTPLGDDVSVVEQLVSTQTGIVVFSNTAQIRTYNDAAGQGELLRTALLRHLNRNVGAYEPPSPPPNPATPAPAPSAASEANIGGLFRRRRATPKPTAAPAATPAATLVSAPLTPAASAAPRAVAAAAPPSPSPRASAPAPARTAAPTPTPRPPVPTPRPPAPTPQPSATPAPKTAATAATVAAAGGGEVFGIVDVGGSADAERREYARTLLAAAVGKEKAQAAPFSSGAAELAARGGALCAETKASAVLGGALSTRSETVLGQPQTSASFELTAYDCAGHVTYRRTFERDAGGDWKNAVDRAVTAAVGAYMHPPKGGRR